MNRVLTKGGPSLDHFKNLVYTWSTTHLGAYWEGFSRSYLPPPIIVAAYDFTGLAIVHLFNTD